MLSSSGFARNERLSQFLRFLVERHLEGRDSELKESVIAVEVFGREPGYDPKLDGIVRTEAVRLRARLEKYYQAEGSQDPLDHRAAEGRLPAGLRQRLAVEPATDIPPGRPERAARFGRIRGGLPAPSRLSRSWRSPRRGGGRARVDRPFTIAVLPLENHEWDPANDYFADGLTDEIIRNLSVIDGLTVPVADVILCAQGQRTECGRSGQAARGRLSGRRFGPARWRPIAGHRRVGPGTR